MVTKTYTAEGELKKYLAYILETATTEMEFPLKVPDVMTLTRLYYNSYLNKIVSKTYNEFMQTDFL